MKTFSGIEKEQICLFFLAFLCFHSFSNNFEKGQRGEEVNLRLVQTRIGIKENGKEGEGANTLKSKMETFSWRHFRELIQIIIIISNVCPRTPLCPFAPFS